MVKIALDGDLVAKLALRKGFTTDKKVCETAGIAANTYRRALKSLRIEAKTAERICKVLGARSIYELIKSDKPDQLRDSVDREQSPPTVLSPEAARGKKLQDVKVVLDDVSYSNRLLEVAGPLPTFLECVLHSVTFTPVSDSHKDRPFLPSFSYNHFIQSSMLVVIKNGDPSLLGYSRMEQLGEPTCVHTSGLSVLFSSARPQTIKGFGTSPLDTWRRIGLTQPQRARHDLIGHGRCLLLETLRHKLDLVGEDVRIEPFGVITNDQRPDYQRIYSQYVFRVDLHAHGGDLDLYVNSLRPRHHRLHRLPEGLDEEDYFTGRDGKKNAMDIVAYRALCSEATQVVFGKCRFTRGFAVT